MDTPAYIPTNTTGGLSLTDGGHGYGVARGGSDPDISKEVNTAVNTDQYCASMLNPSCMVKAQAMISSAKQRVKLSNIYSLFRLSILSKS